ncbi:DEAD/DEAH box helicase [Pseudoxanthomonas winnipegensis]|uniref:DEAD/DEAH box helicase n=1 Tax=Pseudoxanthomonas winnipegensis TaxID=2480810 RepID=UPI001038ABD2|nr:DEAD/DEAH box helicase [Pseudoxanthomonas winnipegensis]TBV77020.1 DEAD/DEAH box helicase [Pseudoxanthomonas winnipegensis]
MTMRENDWQIIENLRGADLKREVFSAIQRASIEIGSGSIDEPKVMETVPRIAKLIQSRPELQNFKDPLNALARATGLWNYIDAETADTADAILVEAVTAQELGGITFHREQISALNVLLSGKNLILSAPTSFGKSLLIDALIASGRYRRIAIVLPTIALLDEFRRRLRRRFENTFDVVMHPNERPSGQQTIFLGTQERLITRDDLGRLDLTVVDEFYKLDPTRQDDRCITLNAAVYKLLGNSKQFFFLGPNIDGVRVVGNERWKFEFLRTRFSTVAVNTYDLKDVPDKEERLYEEIARDENWPALVFVSSPDKANKLVSKASEGIAVSDDGSPFSNWLSTNVGKNWPVVDSVKFGFGVHHGRIPRAIASQMVRLFNRGDIPVLFCTSTLIEGVNTAAKTVLIYDKTINKSDYDFFTFSNIKGRAGRLGEHHVGQVFLFNSPPNEESMQVSPTLFGDEDDAPDDYVVHLDDFDSTPSTDQRIVNLKSSLGLDAASLRLAASVGLETASSLRDSVNRAIQEGAQLSWSQVPKYKQVAAVVDVICKVRKPTEFGAYTAKQISYFINQLRFANTMRSFLVDYDASYSGDPNSYDNIFKFLRACEYGLPQFFSVVEIFVKKHFPLTDYSVFLHELSRWFRAEELKNLDEEGVPIQISERFLKKGDSKDDLVNRLAQAALNKQAQLTNFERQWIISALEIEP